MDDIKVMGIVFGVSVFIGLVIIAVDFIAKRLFNVKAKDEENHSVLQDYNLGKIKVYYLIIVLLTGFGFIYSIVSYFKFNRYVSRYTTHRQKAEKSTTQGCCCRLFPETCHSIRIEWLVTLTKLLRRFNFEICAALAVGIDYNELVCANRKNLKVICF